MLRTGVIILVFLTSFVLTRTIDFGTNGNSLVADTCYKGSDALDKFPLVDGHNDLAYHLNQYLKNQLKNYDFNADVNNNPDFANCVGCHTDLQKLRKGKVGAQFWAAYIECVDAVHPVADTIEQIDVIKRLVKKYSDDLVFATSSSDIEKAFGEKKIASFIGVEGGHSIGNKLSVLRAFYELGVRYLTLTHTCNLRWADAAGVDDTGEPKNNLTLFGQKVVLEMNRLGMLVDLAHVSRNVMIEAIEVSKAPVIFSHSSSRYVYNHTRNVDDYVLKKLANNGGIIMVNFFTAFIAPNATVRDVANHINHIVDVIGTDYIGIGSDYDGVPSTPVGLENASTYPNLFDLLMEQDPKRWTVANLEKLAGRNFVRVLRQAEEIKKELLNEEPIEDILDETFLHM